MLKAKEVFIVDMISSPAKNVEAQKPDINENYCQHSVNWECHIQKLLISQICGPTPSHQCQSYN